MKRFTKKDAEDLKTCIEMLEKAAAPMSNICFNMSQWAGEPIGKTAATSMSEARKNWDKTIREVRAKVKEIFQ